MYKFHNLPLVMRQLISSGKNLTYEHKKKCQPIESDGHKHTN